MSHALSANMRFNYRYCKHWFYEDWFSVTCLIVYISWLVKPNESRNKSRVKQLNTWKPAREDVHPYGLKAGPGEMNATLRATVANKRCVMTPAEAPVKRHCIKRCGLLSVWNQRQKKCLVHSLARKEKRESQREESVCFFTTDFFTINTGLQKGSSVRA